MIDWTKSMQQTYEYYEVDPSTWKDKRLIGTGLSCTINRDLDADTLGSATIDIGESVGEYYIRTYMIAVQNGDRYKIPLGTHLVQTPSSSFDGMVKSVTMDAYTPLIELKENPPPIGYYIRKGENVMDWAYNLTSKHLRAPVVKPTCDTNLFYNFVADTNDTWLTYNRDLMGNAKYRYSLDELGRVLFAPEQDTASLQPIWTYSDDNSSILHPTFDIEHDMFGIPNVVEVIYSDNNECYYARAVNDDPNSPISTVNRGREISYREVNPSNIGDPTGGMVQSYANQLLRELSTLEYTISYTHAYCPVRIGDCVRLNYNRAGLKGVKAKVISQTIKCEPGCPVSEKAVFTAKLWR